jgi:hypothetical protein
MPLYQVMQNLKRQLLTAVVLIRDKLHVTLVIVGDEGFLSAKKIYIYIYIYIVELSKTIYKS